MPSAVPVSRRRRRGLAWVVVVAVAIGAAATLTLKRDQVHAPTRSPAPPANVLLITVDTLRPDALGWVAGRNATPEIDRLAGDSFKFPGAIAPVPLTLPSHAALMTGLFPRRLGLRDNGQVVPPGPRTLAEALKARGYATAAFVSGYPLDSAFGLDRGFDVYDDALSPGSDGDLERPADATLAAALRWLPTAPAPRFAWVHFYDPHYPYEPHAEHPRPGPRGAYDGEVAYVDAAVGRLAAAFGAPDDALIVFAADHGESLGEHGEGTHGFFIYDSTVVVPLFFRWPGRVASGSSAAAARLVDVAPTVLDLLGIPAAAAVDGVSLRATLAGGAAVAEPAYIETFQPWNSYGWSPLKAIRHRGLKLIAAPRPELYDLAIDPGETRNLIGERPSDASALSRLLDAAQKAPAAAPAAIDPDARARLEALGYVSGGAASADPPAEGLRDPKDGNRLRALLTEGDAHLRRAEAAAAVAAFDAVLREDPDNRFALHRSGLALLRSGAPARAVPRLQKAVRLDPASPEARIALAEALSKAGRHKEAVEHWMEATRLQPRRADLWANLGSALGASGRTQEAVAALARAVELKPEDPRLRVRLAFAEHGAGRLPEAARHLQEAATRQGAAFPHSGALGLILVQLGRGEDARPWLARSAPSEPDYAQARRALEALELERR
jgi:arylsulfatase A-like enzyme/cytochrome c-type biogenesis protein CcmH/NrfG